MPTRKNKVRMSKKSVVVNIVAFGLSCLAGPGFAGQQVVIKGVFCTPYSVKGQTYRGCPGDAPPLREDAYLAAKALGDSRSKEKFDMDCADGIGLSSCLAPPTPHGCPAGRAWSLEGTGVAHCVDIGPHYCPPEASNRSVSSDGMPHCD
jgi:hypothetical protein